ncbi:gamma-glutamylcyclotransferase [Novosphingobium sp. ZW T3_23]|uniref:gamma-glutamylcyclotransferase family protein n=1 Tax=Novosphingobium sp. ZW T3_23 TaxID=3378084 RepID=UPI003854D018
MNIDCRLVTYGTLAPGRPNHHHVASLQGRWLTGTIKGVLVNKGWGSEMGYPAFVPDEHGEEIAVHLLESPDLPKQWAYLDAFEGEEYRRYEVLVTTAEGTVEAWIYAADQTKD